MRKIFSVIITVVLSSILTLVIIREFPGWFNSNKNQIHFNASSGAHSMVQQANFRPSNAYMLGSSGLPDFVEAANKSVHAVVHVKVQATRQNFIYDPFAQLFGLGPQRQDYIQQGFGSGVIISPDGYIVTNNHVISDADQIEVTLNNRKTYQARLVGKDPSTDLALIKIDETNLPYLTFGNSEDVKVGEWVLAVGNPFNLNSTVTAGIISAKGRNNIIDHRKNPIESFLQTDAAVNPGNSGGALVNIRGELIGINTAIASNNGAYQGYSFAVPVNIVRKVVNDLLEFGEVRRAFLGVTISEVDDKIAKENGLNEVKGIYVNAVGAGGSAEESGIRKGDIILSIQDYPVNSVSELHEQIAKYRPGDKVTVKYFRKGKEYLCYCVLKSLEQMVKDSERQSGSDDENDMETANKAKAPSANNEKDSNNNISSALGVELANLSEQEMRTLGIKSGVKIKSILPGSKLYRVGVKPGYIVTNINKTPIHSPSDFMDVMKKTKGGVLMEGVYPDGRRAYYGFGN